MMRILFLVDGYLPSTLSSAKLIHDLAHATRDLGHSVTVCAPDADLGSSLEIRDEQGVTVLRVKSGRLKGVWRPLRAINEWRLSSTIWNRAGRYFREQSFDLVVYYSPTIFFGALVRRLKRLWSCPSYLILRDIFPQWAVDTGVIRAGGPVHRLFRRKELEQYAAADWIGVQTPANQDYFEANPLEHQRLEVLLNWMALDDSPIKNAGFREQLGLTHRVVLFQGGNIGVHQDIERLVRLAEYLRDEPSAYILIVGDGSEKKRMRQMIADRDLQNIDVRDSVDQETYFSMLSEFDVGLLTLDHSLTVHNFPGKILGYLRLAKPTLASINPGNDLEQILQSHDVGLVGSEAGDQKFFEGARRLVREPELRRRLGANGRRFLEQRLSATQAASQILSHFETDATR